MGNLPLFLLIIVLATVNILRVRKGGGDPCNHLSGNVHIPDVEHDAVMRMTPDLQRDALIRSPQIRRANALSFGPGGRLYPADSVIPEQVPRPKEYILAQGPCINYPFRRGAADVPGH